jgi:hypothetical protein
VARSTGEGAGQGGRQGSLSLLGAIRAAGGGMSTGQQKGHQISLDILASDALLRRGSGSPSTQVCKVIYKDAILRDIDLQCGSILRR